jgi:hypothetical protein
MELDIREMVQFIYEKLNGEVSKETLHKIFALEEDFLFLKGFIVAEDEFSEGL